MPPVLSHVALFQVPGYDRLLYVTDAAMNIAPDLEAKKHIVSNAVKVAHALGNPNPIVACLCAVEKVNPKMPATLDAAALVEANATGALPGCTVIGPLALDNAVSPEAARHKGITDPNAGHADILLVPNIETGNVFYKSMVFMAKSQNAGLIVGAGPRDRHLPGGQRADQAQLHCPGSGRCGYQPVMKEYVYGRI